MWKGVDLRIKTLPCSTGQVHVACHSVDSFGDNCQLLLILNNFDNYFYLYNNNMIPMCSGINSFISFYNTDMRDSGFKLCTELAENFC